MLGYSSCLSISSSSRKHSEKLQDLGYTQFVLAEVAHQGGGAHSIEALLAFLEAVRGGHPFSLDELAGIAAANDAALRTLQHLVQENRVRRTRRPCRCKNELMIALALKS